MTLPSQVGRIAGPGARVTRKRRRGHGRPWRLIVVVLLVVVGGYFSWRYLFSSSDSDITPAPTTSVVTNDPVSPATTTSPRTFPMPSSSTSVVPDDDPLVYDNPTPIPVAPTHDKSKPAPAPITTKPIPTPTPEPDIEDAPKPVPGTPVLAPTTPIPDEDATVAQRISMAMDLVKRGNKIEARNQLSDLLFNHHSDLSQSHAQIIRSTLKQINDILLFSKRVVDGDPVTLVHLIRSGDYLGPIAQTYHVTYQLLEKINRVKATRIWAGMKLKVIKGPFNAIVDKSDYLMDIYLNDDKGNKVYVATYPIGLGEQDSTPIGIWRVRPGSKVTNPSWPDPNTGKVYQPDDPDNPIGEYWIGLEGTDPNTQNKKGYGIHGTTDASSIGQQRSMGCIRMRADDLPWVYMMLVEKASTVTIRR